VAALCGLACLAALPAQAQLQPGSGYVLPGIGPLFATTELLDVPGIEYPTPSPADPSNPVNTDIKLDPGIFLSGRFVYALTRRLAVEAEVDWAVSVCAIRQLEIKTGMQEGDEPQYETTTFDARITQYGVALSYFFSDWKRVQPFVTGGFGEHILNLQQKGEVDPDPIRDRYIMGGLGLAIHATDKLIIRVELRDFMYNFRFDNQFVDPYQSQLILFRRPDFLRTTSVASDRFQNDLAFTVGFMIQTF
jgi:hypothetical protein